MLCEGPWPVSKYLGVNKDFAKEGVVTLLDIGF